MERLIKSLINLLVTLSICIARIFFPRGVCRFHPTCSEYAMEAARKHQWWRASYLILLRIVKCNPFSRGGNDPVPSNGLDN